MPALGFSRLGFVELLAVLRGVSAFLDWRLLRPVLLQFSTEREGFRLWLGAVAQLARALAERTRTRLDDELACLLIDVVASDEQYRHLYAAIEPLLARLERGEPIDPQAVEAAASRASLQGIDPRLTAGTLDLALLAAAD